MNYSAILFHWKLNLDKFTKACHKFQNKSLHYLYIHKSIHRSKIQHTAQQIYCLMVAHMSYGFGNSKKNM